MRKALDITTFIAALLMAASGGLLVRNNLPAFYPMLPSLILWTVYFGLFVVVAVVLATRRPSDREVSLSGRIAVALLHFAAAAALPFMFLQGAVVDYYQPFSLYDAPIYIMLVSWLLFIILFVIQGIRSLLGRTVRNGAVLWPMLTLLLPLIIPVFNGLSIPDWTGSVEKSEILFEGGVDGYGSYRIPGLLVIPGGSILADGTVLDEDLILAFAEARRDGSLDQGDIDLVLRRSTDGGHTWEKQVVVRRWEDGLGKVGDPTPLFDPATGMLVVAHGAQAHGEPYETWMLYSATGGEDWSEPFHLGEGSPGPGHGAIVTGGEHDGRLIIPAHRGNDGFAWISDDGSAWRHSDSGYPGNESLIASTGNGILTYTSRVPRSVAKPHPRMNKLFGVSLDGGDSWTEYPSAGVVTPICMSGLTSDGQRLWFVNPATVRTRGRLSIRYSDDAGANWSGPELLFPGPAGYADIAVASNGDLLVLAENGRVEYDQRISIARIPR